MRQYIGGVILGLAFGAAGMLSAFAQAPAAPAVAVAQGPTGAKPEYTETERLMVQLVQVSDQLATCRGQLGQKGVADLSLDVRSRIEAAHPGMTVNWQTGALVPKTAPPK